MNTTEQQIPELPEDGVEYTVEAHLNADSRGKTKVWVPMAFHLRTPADARRAREQIAAALPDTACRVLRWTSTAAVVDDAELDAAVSATVRPLAEKAA